MPCAPPAFRTHGIAPGRRAAIPSPERRGVTLSRLIAAAGLLALCGACDRAGARTLADRQISPADVFVRAAGAPDGEAASLLLPAGIVPDGSEARPFTS